MNKSYQLLKKRDRNDLANVKLLFNRMMTNDNIEIKPDHLRLIQKQVVKFLNHNLAGDSTDQRLIIEFLDLHRPIALKMYRLTTKVLLNFEHLKTTSRLKYRRETYVTIRDGFGQLLDKMENISNENPAIN